MGLSMGGRLREVWHRKRGEGVGGGGRIPSVSAQPCVQARRFIDRNMIFSISQRNGYRMTNCKSVEWLNSGQAVERLASHQNTSALLFPPEGQTHQ